MSNSTATKPVKREYTVISHASRKNGTPLEGKYTAVSESAAKAQARRDGMKFVTEAY